MVQTSTIRRSAGSDVLPVPQDVLAALRGQIREIERRPVSVPCQTPRTPWSFGVPGVDALLGPDGLETGAIHEIKPAVPQTGSSWTAAWASAFIFSLMLAVRRVATGSSSGPAGPVLCCRPAVTAGELGCFHGLGLRAFGLDPAQFAIVETSHASDALWAIEEGLKSASMALVIGVLDEVDLTPARRLALAAQAHRSPCILLTHPRGEATAAIATRWRVGPAPSAPHPFDVRAPGARRFSVELARCRTQPIAAETAAFCVEWCDETFCFRLAPGLADRADATRRSMRSAR